MIKNKNQRKTFLVFFALCACMVNHTPVLASSQEIDQDMKKLLSVCLWEEENSKCRGDALEEKIKEKRPAERESFLNQKFYINFIKEALLAKPEEPAENKSYKAELLWNMVEAFSIPFEGVMKGVRAAMAVASEKENALTADSGIYNFFDTIFVDYLYNYNQISAKKIVTFAKIVFFKGGVLSEGIFDHFLEIAFLRLGGETDKISRLMKFLKQLGIKKEKWAQILYSNFKDSEDPKNGGVGNIILPMKSDEESCQVYGKTYLEEAARYHINKEKDPIKKIEGLARLFSFAIGANFDQTMEVSPENNSLAFDNFYLYLKKHPRKREALLDIFSESALEKMGLTSVQWKNFLNTVESSALDGSHLQKKEILQWVAKKRSGE